MDARSTAQRIVSIVIILLTVSCPAFAGIIITYGGSFDLSIPAEPGATKGWMTDALIEITDHYLIQDIDVRISSTHTSAFDLQLFLQSPAGTRICLNMYNPSDEFFEGENYSQTIFDDEADISISLGEAPFTGRFKPKEPYLLSAFDDEDIYGSWRLQIYDAFSYNTGTLDSFELIITTHTPEPATAILLLLGSALFRLKKPPQSQTIQ